MIVDTRAIYFPYCVQQRKDKTWLVLNRNYKLLGQASDDWVDYDAQPAEACIARITPTQVQKISYCGTPEYPDTIYLYNDGCIPTSDKKSMDAYLTRVSALMKLKTVYEKSR